MSRLLDLVRLRHDLVSVTDQLSIKNTFDQQIMTVAGLMGRNDQVERYNQFDDLLNYYDELISHDSTVSDRISSLLAKINSEIELVVTELENSEAYKEKFSYAGQPVNYSAPASMPLDLTTKTTLENAIRRAADWHYAGLLISARSLDWIELVTTSDPLYLTSYDLTNLNTLLKYYFPDQYRQKLAIYQIIDHDYSALPQAQFGIVVCWEYFNYICRSEVEKCMGQVYDLLRPGGTFIFSYNDCDQVTSAQFTELSHMSYSSASTIKKLVEKFGFEIVTMTTSDLPRNSNEDFFFNQISWAELRKPGLLSTSKLRPVVGGIRTK